jgi:hypothetical protein
VRSTNAFDVAVARGFEDALDRRASRRSSRSAALAESGASMAATFLIAERRSSGRTRACPGSVSDSGRWRPSVSEVLAAHEAAADEASQDAAQVTGVEPEVAREVARGDAG